MPPGDMRAAHDNGVLFYPIRPGDEVGSWKEFKEVYMRNVPEPHMGQGSEAVLIGRFDECLFYRHGKLCICNIQVMYHKNKIPRRFIL